MFNDWETPAIEKVARNIVANFMGLTNPALYPVLDESLTIPDTGGFTAHSAMKGQANYWLNDIKEGPMPIGPNTTLANLLKYKEHPDVREYLERSGIM